MQNKTTTPQIRSVITCPHCQAAALEHMPVDACQWFYRCNTCNALLTPKKGDCCVFCSYGTIPCPPIQMGNSCRKPA